MKKTVSVLMALMMTIAFLFSGCAFAEGNSDDELEIMLSNMTLREKVAQMMIASFRGWQEVPEKSCHHHQHLCH